MDCRALNDALESGGRLSVYLPHAFDKKRSKFMIEEIYQDFCEFFDIGSTAYKRVSSIWIIDEGEKKMFYCSILMPPVIR